MTKSPHPASLSSSGIDFYALPTPFTVVDEVRLLQNLKLLRSIADETGCKVLLAQKAFSMYSLYPLIAEYLDGATASGLFEAKLGHEEMRAKTAPFERENHVFSPAYADHEFDEITSICGHIVFNSVDQYNRFAHRAVGKELGIRVNPECSTQDADIYDPCAAGSRLGATRGAIGDTLPAGISGIHFHTLCEQNADALEQTLDALEEKFGDFLALDQIKWLNFGGGHHITRTDYDVALLKRLIKRMADKYNVQVYIEPGEAVVLNTGFLAATVLEILDNNGITNAILDTSASCHMPDVIEMPYRPEVIGAGKAGERAHTYRFGGPTCLAGDIIGDYSFEKPLSIGDRVVFCDMAHYSMVKSNMFNGMNLPSIAFSRVDGTVELIKSFGYADFKGRL